MSNLVSPELNAQVHPDSIFTQLCQDVGSDYDGVKITAYSDLLRRAAREVVEQLVKEDKALQNNLRAVFLIGEVANGSARPFINLVEDQPLPEKTFTLWQLIYTWLFTFAAKPVDVVAETRFLDADLSSKVDLIFLLLNPGEVIGDQLIKAFQDRFKTTWGFLPVIRIVFQNTTQIKLSKLPSMICIYGSSQLSKMLQELDGRSESTVQHLVYSNAVNQMVPDIMGFDSQDKTYDQVIQNYLQIRDFPESSICLDWMPDAARTGSMWHKSNEMFFNHILDGQFDKVCVEDITKGLHDNRNVKKKNQFTIIKVNGLNFNDQFIPATNVVMKLRGFSDFRGDINNWVDILKEYMNYTVLHAEIGSPVDFILDVGPLMLTCEKLDLPLSNEMKQRLIGIFIEEIVPLEGCKILSSRIKYLTDFWKLDKSVSQILIAADHAGIVIDKSSLRKYIRGVISHLLAKKLRIDYCDIAVIVDNTGQIRVSKLFDFERTSFQELSSEQHVFIETFFDIKRRLKKAYWANFLESIYSPIKHGGDAQIKILNQYLIPKNHKRARMYKFLWIIRDTIFLSGKTIGNWFWKRVFLLIAETSSRGYQLIN